MKKLILLLIVTSFTSNILYANNFNWTKVITSKDGNTAWYYDKKSIRKVGNYKFYWHLADYLKDYDEDKSVVSHSMVNCDTYEMKWITYTGYSDHMGRGTINFESIVPEDDITYFKWEYFDPKTTVQGLITKKVCNSE